jgi:hypothetical protein
MSNKRRMFKHRGATLSVGQHLLTASIFISTAEQSTIRCLSPTDMASLLREIVFISFDSR